MSSLDQERGPDRKRSPNQGEGGDLAREIAALDDMELEALRRRWRGRWAEAPPSCASAELLRFEIAWRLQAALEGDLDPVSLRTLRSHARALRKTIPVKALKPSPAMGSTIVREWRGRTYRVQVTQQGFLHDGKAYRSLTAAAQAITGMHRSGAKFFGVGR